MKKLILILVSLAIVGGVFYFISRPKPDETKTVSEPEALTLPAVSEDTDLTTIDQELQATELGDFDKEINELDQSINQL